VQYCEELGAEVAVRRVTDLQLDEVFSGDYDGVLVSPGPGHPRETPLLFDVIRGCASRSIPLLGVCLGLQALAEAYDTPVIVAPALRHGRSSLVSHGGEGVFAGVANPVVAGRYHSLVADRSVLHPDLRVTAETADGLIMGLVHATAPLEGVQFHPEVLHSENGQEILRRWLIDIVGCKPVWNSQNIVATEVAKIKEQVGTKRVICGLSGGVDSAVAAAIVQKAIGSQLTCVFVDHGLLREGEAEQVEKDFVAATGVSLMVVDARQKFLDALAGVTDPETKRKIIGREFIRTFEEAARELSAHESVDFLVQGTLYPDVVESGGGTGTANIKSHHNVGGLPDDLQFALIEPLRTLFKDEVREAGLELGLPGEIVWRQPFPGPGLAIRIIGEVTENRLTILRKADLIVREELKLASLDREIWQCPVVLLADVRSVGVQGDGRTYGHPIVLRPVSSEDAMTADWSRLPYDVLEKISTRITNEVREINRVTLDLTSKPPGTIEWE